MTIGSLLLIGVLASSPDVEALRRELDAVAARIEQLKAQRLAGESVEGELEPLLVRSQELAEQLERALPEPATPPAAAAPDTPREHADELRDQAAALRGQAHRLTLALAALVARIATARRPPTARAPEPSPSEPSLPQATLASTSARDDDDSSRAAAQTAIGPLVQQRARLEAHITALRVEASRLEAEANALDAE